MHIFYTQNIIFVPVNQDLNFYNMARKKLFNTLESLYEGYFGEIPIQKGKKPRSKEARKVTLKGRVLNDKISLYIYSCINGRVVRVTTGSFLNVETTPQIKIQNEETLRLANMRADLMNADAEREGNGFRPLSKKKTSLIDYTLKTAEKALAKTGNKHGYYYTLRALAQHLEKFCGDKTRLCDVDKDFIMSFVEYLRNDAQNINYLRADDKDKWRDVALSENSQHRLFANLHYIIKKAQKEKITPANGVYASTTTIGDKAYPSVTNIGTRPTYTDDSGVSIETHIIGYDGDLYGTDITVGFLRRLRDERKFPSPEELSKQIAADIELALNVNKQ